MAILQGISLARFVLARLPTHRISKTIKFAISDISIQNTLVIYHIINRFARTCHLGFDGQPTCDCPPGYVGRRCEQCATGYQGNPLIPGDMCVPLQQCDPNGSLSPNADPHTGKCHCKV